MHWSNYLKSTVYIVSQKIPPDVFLHFVPNGWGCLVQILHAYSRSTLDCRFLFNYLQFCQSYAILSPTTQFKSATITHAFRPVQKSLLALLIIVCGKSSQICCSALLAALGWSLALTEVCEMLEASHPTHGSRVG